MFHGLVCLFGAAGSGKDTVADFLVQNHQFVKVAFADPIKRAARDWFDFTEEQLWGPSSERNKPDTRYGRPVSVMVDDERELRKEYLTPRKALQFMGTEIGRELYPDVWVDYAIRVANRLLSERYHALYYTADAGLWEGHNMRRVGGVVISDGRFRNELDAIKAAGGKAVKLVRKNHVPLQGAAGSHRSETEQESIPTDLFDHHLINGGSGLEFLEAATTGLYESLL